MIVAASPTASITNTMRSTSNGTLTSRHFELCGEGCDDMENAWAQASIAYLTSCNVSACEDVSILPARVNTTK